MVILATEDTRSTIRLRLEVAGADLDRVHMPAHVLDDGTELPISIADDIDQLADVLATIEPGAVILDPLKDFLGDSVNTDREDEVRPALTPLLKLTESLDAPVIGLHHLNKSLKGDFLSRLTGSGAFKNVARSILGVAHDTENDVRVLEQKKTNLAAAARGAMQARVESVDATIDGRTESVGRWVMDGVAGYGLDAVLAVKEQGGHAPSKSDAATTFLRGYLGDGQPHLREDVIAAAAVLDASDVTIARAFRKLGGVAKRASEQGARTFWSLPTTDAPPSRGNVPDRDLSKGD